MEKKKIQLVVCITRNTLLHGCLKLNWDGADGKSDGKAGIGIVVVDTEGQF